jgi:hypothetical protein
MGEYATFEGERIKIGTCEDMYYLRADQVGRLSRSDVDGYWSEVRFRFPFPDEDDIEPGAFRDHDRSVSAWGLEPPAELDHHAMQFGSTYPGPGVLVMLPCPFSEAGKASGTRYMFNGFAGAVRIVQQRIWEGRLALVLECGACGARYRCPTFEDAEPVVVACRAQADRLQHLANVDPRGNHEDGQVGWWHAIADRITAGYASPPDWVVREWLRSGHPEQR